MKTLSIDSVNRAAPALLEHLSVAVLCVDTRLHVSYLNPSAESLLGISLRQARGVPVDRLLVGDRLLPEQMRHSLESGHPCTLREVSLHSAGRDVVIDCAMSPVEDAALGACLLVEMMDIDRHLRIAREEHLLAQQQATRSLLRGLAHEIKNPLGGLRGAAQLLDSELAKPEQREYTEVILREADRLRSLVDRMIGSPTRPKMGMVNIHEVLEHVRRLVTLDARGQKLRVSTRYDPSIPEIYAAGDLLIQAVLNIVRNASQVMSEQDDAQIILHTKVMRQFTIGHVRHRLVARMDIEDNGPGIPFELQDTLFLPMVSGRKGGIGLGLSISQSLIAQHGGLIEFVSQPGKTVFTLLLPLEPVSELSFVS